MSVPRWPGFYKSGQNLTIVADAIYDVAWAVRGNIRTNGAVSR